VNGKKLNMSIMNLLSLMGSVNSNVEVATLDIIPGLIFMYNNELRAYMPLQ
jgi:hypothetical protein